jgi:hypothetical protein
MFEPPTHEQLPGADWNAMSFVTMHWQLATDIQELFLDLDPREITKTVLDHRQVDMPRAIEALDDWFGEIADPAADEDEERAIDQDLRNIASRITEAVIARPGGFVGERVRSTDWSAGTFAAVHPELAADLTELLTALDLVQITKEVLDEPGAKALAVTLALDSWFGDIADPYADEDDD